MKQHIWTVVSCLVIGFLGGVGTNQIAMANEVREHRVKLEQLEKEQGKMDVQWEKRLDNVVELWRSNLAAQQALAQQQTELISLVRQVIAQNSTKGN